MQIIAVYFDKHKKHLSTTREQIAEKFTVKAAEVPLRFRWL